MYQSSKFDVLDKIFATQSKVIINRMAGNGTVKSKMSGSDESAIQKEIDPDYPGIHKSININLNFLSLHCDFS